MLITEVIGPPWKIDNVKSENDRIKGFINSKQCLQAILKNYAELYKFILKPEDVTKIIQNTEIFFLHIYSK